MSQHKAQFIALLEELFQLDQPELDFGLYRILHARSDQIKAFVQNELGQEIDAAFAGQARASAADALVAARLKVEQTLGSYAFADGELKHEFRTTPLGREYELAKELAQKGGPLADDAQVYDHLHRFFSRYYDKGDFMSKRYFVAENDSRAAPYAVPYDGREVMLHWANKDQYYIKSSEYLANFTVDLAAAVHRQANAEQSGFDFKAPATAPLKVHFRLAAATEGEHNNVKEGTERFFLIHDPEPVVLLPLPRGPARRAQDATPVAVPSGARDGAWPTEGRGEGGSELILQFQYRPDPEKAGQAGTWQQKRLAEAESRIKQALTTLPGTEAFADALFSPASTVKQPGRTLLGKYLGQYTSRNTMDYFIHKNLGGFLRRELDFYIKNEIMRLDDIESAEAPRVESYLKKLQVLRKIARSIITFLAQLEDFQKKLWLKKKFVVETQYCITLDRIPESFYPAIAANEAQREEWVRLFAIDEIKGDMATPGYSVPLMVEFLKANPFLMLDTALFDEETKAKLIASQNDIDGKCDGVLLHSDNFQALNFSQNRLNKLIKAVYIDPPYNTDAGPIAYKNGYRSSSWCSLIADRLSITPGIMRDDAIFCATIDDYQYRELGYLIEQQFGQDNLIGTIAIRINPSGRPVPTGLAQAHEYAILSKKTSVGELDKLPRTEKQSARYKHEDDDGNFMWELFRKRGSNSERKDRPSLFYPIYIQGEEVRVPVMTWDEDARVWIDIEPPLETEKAVYPIDDTGAERTWRGKPDNIRDNPANYKAKAEDSGKVTIYYKFRPGSDGVLPPTNWIDAKYSATEHGTGVLKHYFTGLPAFTYPKSIYAVEDCLRISGLGKAESALDYFAGSGTTAHAVINLNREDEGSRKYTLVEMGAYFDTVLKPRIQKVVYSKDWKDGKPVSREGISHCFKTLRLESYEATLNNLVLPPTSPLAKAGPEAAEMGRDYLLKYWLEFETADSPSLLNVRQFADPTAYTLMVKQPGSEAQVQKNVDLVETFNWLIGLHVAQLDQPRRFSVDLHREPDPDLPQDQATRWKATAIREREDGEFWFRWVEGHVLAVPGDESSRQRMAVLWRKLGLDPARDQAALEAYLGKRGINPLESEFETLYVNGSHALPSDGSAAGRIRLIEETFAQRMWEDA